MNGKHQHIVLQTQDLSVGYFKKKKALPVISNINLTLHKGELIGLVGANGIGKSTMLRTLAGMQRSISGNILINNQSLNSIHPIQLATLLSVVLTETIASKNLTVLEFVSLGRQPYTNWMGSLTPTDHKKIDEAMEQTDVAHLAHNNCFELSDGQLQRVAIARALAQDTPLIILDEPTTHLDIYHRAYILKLLKKLAAETGKTILFSTHEIDLAIQLTHKLIVLSSEKVSFDTPHNIISQGLFNDIFPKDTIYFDTTSGRFTIKD